MAEPYTPTDEQMQELFVENLPGASDDWDGAHALWERVYTIIDRMLGKEVVR